jgi:hypothetical protein
MSCPESETLKKDGSILARQGGIRCPAGFSVRENSEKIK